MEKALAKAPITLPAVVLLNFRDKHDEEPHDETVDRGITTGGTSVPAVQKPPPNAPASLGNPPSPTVAREGAEEDMPSEEGGKAGTGDSARTEPNHAGNFQTAENDQNIGTESSPTSHSKLPEDGGNEGLGTATIRVGDEPRQGEGGGGIVVTLQDARAMVDRVTKADEAEGRGHGRLVSLFDCSMKNCFGLRVLYTYLNVPYLELKRQSLLQQAKLAGERLEREVRELEGFIGGHSYDNYMKHLQAADFDPTAGMNSTIEPFSLPTSCCFRDGMNRRFVHGTSNQRKETFLLYSLRLARRLPERRKQHEAGRYHDLRITVALLSVPIPACNDPNPCSLIPALFI